MTLFSTNQETGKLAVDDDASLLFFYFRKIIVPVFN